MRHHTAKTTCAAPSPALALGQSTRGVKRLGIAHSDPFIHELTVERLGNEIFADAFHLPGPRRVSREHRPLRIGADDASWPQTFPARSSRTASPGPWFLSL